MEPNLAELLDEGSSQYCARQGVALSEGAANLNLQVSLGVLEHHFGEAAAPGHGQSWESRTGRSSWRPSRT